MHGLGKVSGSFGRIARLRGVGGHGPFVLHRCTAQQRHLYLAAGKQCGKIAPLSLSHTNRPLDLGAIYPVSAHRFMVGRLAHVVQHAARPSITRIEGILVITQVKQGTIDTTSFRRSKPARNMREAYPLRRCAGATQLARMAASSNQIIR